MNIKYFVLTVIVVFYCLDAAASDPPKQVWRVTLGAGDGQVTVAGGKVYSLGLFAPDGTSTLGRGKTPKTAEVLICLEADSGKEVWRRIVAKEKVKRGSAYEYEHGVPQVYENRVYVRGAWGTVGCFDAESGKQVWLRDVESLSAKAMDHGYQSSPLIHDGLLITTLCVAGQRRDVRLLALKLADGKEVWQVQLGTAGRGHWSSPCLAQLDGRTQLLVFYNQYLLGLNPKDGSESWRYDAFPLRAEDRTPSTFGHTPEDQNPPIVVDDVVIAEYRHQAKKGMVCDSDYFAVRVQNDKAELLWSSPDFINWWDSQAVAGGMVYGIRREPKGRFGSTQARYAYRTKDLQAFLECRSPETGKAIWSEGNLLGPDADHHFPAATFAIEGKQIFIQDENRLIGAVLSADGYTYQWQIDSKGPAARPVAASGKLFVRMVRGADLLVFNLRKKKE